MGIVPIVPGHIPLICFVFPLETVLINVGRFVASQVSGVTPFICPIVGKLE